MRRSIPSSHGPPSFTNSRSCLAFAEGGITHDSHQPLREVSRCRDLHSADRVSSQATNTFASTTAMVKGFGCRQAYESLSCRNPRATIDGYGDFELRPMSAMARPKMGSAVVVAERPLRCDFAQSSRSRTRLVATLSADILATDTRGFVAGGGKPAADARTRSCRVMERSPGSLPSHPAVRVAASSARIPR